MAKKKIVSSHQVVSEYMNYVLENGHQPKTVYSFSKALGIEEADFYKYFASFDLLEKTVFSEFYENCVQLLSKNEEYQNYDARHQLLSFYYTFFEILTANRSYVKAVLEEHKDTLKKVKLLAKLKKKFCAYIDDLEFDKIDLPSSALSDIQDKSFQEAAWIQLLLIMKFWLDDDSMSFEKTDIFIEKSVNAGFDIIDASRLKSVIDLGKFILKEKIKR
jgi:hypothetical protein